ncbi:preprotein translocase subunit SecG [Paracoccus sp. Z330]|uniref:Protein-export membrane protein SecG n=1 Tax=Paracoccus onchidii TaxID=3017813 RepID=A0ABT4ZC09_9RHOB|nr:preprotein translocase subunit SecG [Paracoccus onchidii]MDB6176483.1 preprotein translocase subunit SecG [Paracoccus onchidii]
MENVVLTIHLILAVLLTGVVLLQRSEGGGLGVGGGSGGGVMSGRQAANALTRLTWVFGIAIFCTSIALTIIAARQSANSSIMDQLGVPEQQGNTDSGLPSLPTYTPPPSTGGDPLTPPAPDAPAAGSAAPAAQEPAAQAPEAEAPAGAAITPPAAETAPANETSN